MDSRWYLAQTLNERLVSYKENNCPANGTESELAGKRLARWKAGMAFRQDSIFQQFLSDLDLNENEFKELLGQGKEQIKESTGKPLAWVSQVLDCLDNAENWNNDPARFEPGSAGVPAASTPFQNDKTSMGMSDVFRSFNDFLVLIEPLITDFRSKLQAHANDLQSKSGLAQLNPDTMAKLLTTDLNTRLRRLIQKTLILETNIARLENRLSGETKAERYASFIKLISTNEGRLAIYLEYPVLIRRVFQMLEQWLIVSCEFLDRFHNDYNLLDQQFSLGSASVVAISGGAEDLHRQGRSVHVIEFANNKKLVYKPRPLAADCVFNDLLQYLADRGLNPDLQMAKTIDRGDYGCCEHIAYKDCSNESQIKRFYERQGMWLALLYTLGTTDLHWENLIACGEHPVVIDFETIFHPEMSERKHGSADDLASTRLFDSVMAVGLLPTPVRGAGRTMDSSGIGAKPDQVLPFDVDSIENLGTDEVHVGKAPGRIGQIHSNPRLKGSLVEAVKYHKEIKKGFASTYRILQSLTAELLGKDGWFERFSKLPIRAVIRRSSYYTSLLSESHHPTFNRMPWIRISFSKTSGL